MTKEETNSPATPSIEELGGVSIVIPAYNEEGGIAGVVQELLGILEDCDELLSDWEVVVVNDGSTDRTTDEVKPFIGGRVRLVEHPVNQGYGAALKTGIRNARFPWIMITDADGTYPNTFIPSLLEHRAEQDMIVGARIGENSHIPLIRRPPKWVLRKLASYLSQKSIPDLNSGLRLMRRNVLEQFLNILPNGFSFTTTITLAMFSAGFRVKYVPIDYLKRTGRSKIRPIADTLNFLKLIIPTSLYFDPLRVFIPVSFLFFFMSVFVGVGSLLFTEKMMDVTTVLLFVTGVQMLALGMFADMINRRLS